jgi:replication factor C subunit 3/5
MNKSIILDLETSYYHNDKNTQKILKKKISTESDQYVENKTSITNFFIENTVNNKKPTDNLPWIEKYRPNELESISSHKYIKKLLNKFINNESLPHLLLYGPPGTGKTSTIISCAKQLFGSYYSYMVLEFNASDERGVDIVRDKIKTFVYSKNFFTKGLKLVILDEIDAMTYDAQKILRQVIEKYSENARFCLICNYVSKIINSLHSRCLKLKFMPISNKIMYNRLEYISNNEQFEKNKEGIDAIIKLSNGDMRKAINILQSTFMTFQQITEENVHKIMNNYNNDDINLILQWIKDKSYQECYNYINNLKYKRDLTLKNLIDNFSEYFINNIHIVTNTKELFSGLANIEYNETYISNEQVQLGALVGLFKLYIKVE